jgi:hypothetical protein
MKTNWWATVLLAILPVLLLTAPSLAADPRVQDRADCEQDCMAKCANAPMKKFICERRCRSTCKKETPSATDVKPRKK